MSKETSTEEYNGWCNRETWATVLHLSNDEGLYETCLVLVEGKAKWSGGDAIEAWLMGQVDELLHGYEYPIGPDNWVAMLISDVGSFWRVDWQAVAESFIEEES
jgi:hypothetical protein